jgi:predicted CoA-binding protein
LEVTATSNDWFHGFKQYDDLHDVKVNVEIVSTDRQQKLLSEVWASKLKRKNI